MKLALLVSENDGTVEPTSVARLLAEPGLITCDEYLHYIARAFSDPSPALERWKPQDNVRHPLLFALKYLLAKQAASFLVATPLNEVLGAYQESGYSGDEDDTSFLTLLERAASFEAIGRAVGTAGRQARESLQVLAQISYLHLDKDLLSVSLDSDDAAAVFQEMRAVLGASALQRDEEIRRLANLFQDGATEDFYDYPHTALNEVVESGFAEGTKVQKTHIVIERNRELRQAFFAANPTPICDVCALDTALTYTWTARVLDLHHLLPLASGTRVTTAGTTLQDLVAVCPTCHRAVHRYYDHWLQSNNLRDFPTETQARSTYYDVKTTFRGAVHVK